MAESRGVDVRVLMRLRMGLVAVGRGVPVVRCAVVSMGGAEGLDVPLARGVGSSAGMGPVEGLLTMIWGGAGAAMVGCLGWGEAVGGLGLEMW